MSVNPAVQETVSLFRSCVRMEKTSRVPNISNDFTWKFFDSDEYTADQIVNDYNLITKTVQEYHDRYQFDAYMDFGTRNPHKVLQILGGDTGTQFDAESGAINYIENVIMQPDEYSNYANNTTEQLWKMFLRRYPGLTKGQFVKAIAAMMEFGQFMQTNQAAFLERNNAAAVMDTNFYMQFPANVFFSLYRGVKGFSADMRKHKAEMKEAFDTYFEERAYPKFKASFANTNETCVTDYWTSMLGHSFMSPKQFEELFWPYLKRTIDDVVAAGKTINIFSESSMMRFAEFFEDIPKGHVLIHPEVDDVVELRKRLPNIAIAGGMKASLLANGTPEECADYAKYLLDSMGEGYIFSQDKMLSFRSDCRRENLLAVNEVVRNYRV